MQTFAPPPMSTDTGFFIGLVPAADIPESLSLSCQHAFNNGWNSYFANSLRRPVNLLDPDEPEYDAFEAGWKGADAVVAQNEDQD